MISISLYWALDAAMLGCTTRSAILATARRSVGTLLEHSVKRALGFWQALGHSYQGQLLIQARRRPNRGAMSA